MYPLLSLSKITLEPELARSLPRRLAYYHLALPIARDGDHITVAMANPENQRVVQLLEAVLGLSIIPVRSPVEEIRRSLDQIWQQIEQCENDATRSTVMHWTDDPGVKLDAYAREIAGVLSLKCLDEVIFADAPEAFFNRVDELRPALVVTAIRDPETLAQFFARTATPVLLMRGKTTLPQSILHVLRGHTPDRRVLEWLIPIMDYTRAAVTLLAAARTPITDYRQGNPLTSDFSSLLMPDHSTQLIESGRVLASMRLNGKLKIQQGTLETVMVNEVLQHDYDLVAIAAEAYGDYVYRVLQQLNDNHSNVLVVKP